MQHQVPTACRQPVYPNLPAILIPCLQRFTCRLPIAISRHKLVLHGLQRGRQAQLGRKGEQVLDFTAASGSVKSFGFRSAATQVEG